MDELVIEGEKYISSKRAAKVSGFAQDYVGQLCRGGKLDCRQVGKAWYVNLNALEKYTSGNSVSGNSVPNNGIQDSGAETTVSGLNIGGKEYISVNRAVDDLKSNSGEFSKFRVDRRRIDGNWYLSRESANRMSSTRKDETIPSQAPKIEQHSTKKEETDIASYKSDDRPLNPEIGRPKNSILREVLSEGNGQAPITGTRKPVVRVDPRILEKNFSATTTTRDRRTSSKNIAIPLPRTLAVATLAFALISFSGLNFISLSEVYSSDGFGIITRTEVSLQASSVVSDALQQISSTDRIIAVPLKAIEGVSEGLIQVFTDLIN